MNRMNGKVQAPVDYELKYTAVLGKLNEESNENIVLREEILKLSREIKELKEAEKIKTKKR